MFRKYPSAFGPESAQGRLDVLGSRANLVRVDVSCGDMECGSVLFRIQASNVALPELVWVQRRCCAEENAALETGIWSSGVLEKKGGGDDASFGKSHDTVEWPLALHHANESAEQVLVLAHLCELSQVAVLEMVGDFASRCICRK